VTFVGQDAQSTLSLCAHWIYLTEAAWGIWQPAVSEPARDQLKCVRQWPSSNLTLRVRDTSGQAIGAAVCDRVRGG
jgi:hypothetical protein